ncbi:SUMF1/EgtB/PvdO family nonheme iron enzyme [Thermomonospora umbrina]|nr:SUMF1/EgtB/PvdO family nonheme iron enzyme [Thermomonospora umbrina]
MDDHDDPRGLFRRARALEAEGDHRRAASVYDRAYGLDPTDAEVAEARRTLLDRLAVVEHGLRFRYVPAGTFLMGSDVGDPDESPVHPVRLGGHWMAETAVSWSTYCDLMGWEPPPIGFPKEEQGAKMAGFHLHEENKIRLQYCEDATTRAVDWHAHAVGQKWRRGGEEVDASELFGTPPREDPRRPYRYDTKPMVAVSWQSAEALCERLSTDEVRYRLPSEAEWERAARGGLVGRRHPWGDAPPTPERCDFDRFDAFSILPMRALPPNGYGLYAMTGSVWEWTSDRYDAQGYPADAPPPPADGDRVLRGGSWADCAEVVTVSFRMSRASGDWRTGRWGDHLAPNIGFRLCREEITPAG